MKKVSKKKYKNELKFFGINILMTLLIFSFLNCSGSKENMDLQKVEGTIVIVGNEPFTYPAIQISQDMTYIINCDEKDRKNFFENQGKRFVIYYNEIKLGPIGKEIKMVKFEELNN
ncbi:MAG: hypothetical protein STSR0008_24800 [Ignavibacterium sp.]